METTLADSPARRDLATCSMAIRWSLVSNYRVRLGSKGSYSRTQVNNIFSYPAFWSLLLLLYLTLFTMLSCYIRYLSYYLDRFWSVRDSHLLISHTVHYTYEPGPHISSMNCMIGESRLGQSQYLISDTYPIPWQSPSQYIKVYCPKCYEINNRKLELSNNNPYTGRRPNPPQSDNVAI
jgi:hypothetical protein